MYIQDEYGHPYNLAQAKTFDPFPVDPDSKTPKWGLMIEWPNGDKNFIHPKEPIDREQAEGMRDLIFSKIQAGTKAQVIGKDLLWPSKKDGGETGGQTFE